MPSPPIDSYQRQIDYLRLSVTDRCNLRCSYCMPKYGVPRIEHQDVLRYEEILRLTQIITGMGISKIRITGGEPLVRRDIVYLCQNIARIPGLKSLSLTTNGALLSQFAQSLFEAGIRRINVSLDTLQPEKYATITGRDCFSQVWKGILLAKEVGFEPIKLNIVVMKGVNDDEIEDLGRLTYEYPFHIRFIELMPFQSDEQSQGFVSADEILTRLTGISPLLSILLPEGNGPARHYQYQGAMGKIGIISPMSHHFCSSCNRLRITSDGKLRTCLFAAEETDLRAILRKNASDGEVQEAIRAAITRKPEKHLQERQALRKCLNRPMSSIGG